MSTDQKSIDYLICKNCESPCYAYEVDDKLGVVDALCVICGNEDASEFQMDEEFEDKG